MSKSNRRDLGHGISCIDTNYIRPDLACFYLLRAGDEFAVIETGTSHCAVTLLQVLDAMGVSVEQVRYVIPTHVHLDHAGGAGAMMAFLPEAALLLHPRGARHMADPARLVASSIEVYGEQRFHQLYGEIVPVDNGRIREMEDRSSVSLGDRRLEFRHTRGHANHHFCVWDEASQGWFSGDMFGISYPWFRFPGGDFVLPTTTPTQFDPGAFQNSLELLASYSPERMYLTHSGALDYSEDKLELLAGQVAHYAEIAANSAADLPGLETALTDYTLGLLQEFDTGLEETQLRELLAFDMDLNAQGLAIWQSRLAG